MNDKELTTTSPALTIPPDDLHRVRLLCICSPAGQEEFFMAIGIPVADRTTTPPPLDDAAQAAFKAKVEALAPEYRTELLPQLSEFASGFAP